MWKPVAATPILATCALLAWSAASEEPAPDPFPGTYRVKGRTVDQHTGDTRVIEGIVVLSEEDGVYTGTSELETQYPSEGGPMDAHVLGRATGRRDGAELSGTAETQLVMGTVPGVHAEFAFVPRVVGPRLVSTWTAHFRGDGTLVIELRNEGREGEEYSPTRTELFGTRISAEDAPATE
jgi:hypothetical protein